MTRITGDAPAGTRRRRGIKRDAGSGVGSAVRRTACCPAPVPDTPLGHLLPYLGYGAHGGFGAGWARWDVLLDIFVSATTGDLDGATAFLWPEYLDEF